MFLEVRGMPFPMRGESAVVSDGEVISPEQGIEDFDMCKLFPAHCNLLARIHGARKGCF